MPDGGYMLAAEKQRKYTDTKMHAGSPESFGQTGMHRTVKKKLAEMCKFASQSIYLRIRIIWN